MKLDLSLVAVVLSIIAIGVSVAQPISDYVSNTGKADEGEPSFKIIKFDFFETYTRIYVQNNGTAPAHNILVVLYFNGSGLQPWEETESMAELNDTGWEALSFPIGRFQLESALPPEGLANATRYECDILISCNETKYPIDFHYEHIIY
jgi:hypothetical protein